MTTKNQVLGKKFEIYVYNLFLELGRKVERDLIYTVKGKRVQIDLKEGCFLGDKIYELKYSRGRVGTFYGDPVEQILRAGRLTGYRIGGIITNGYFSKEVGRKAAGKKVRLYDLEDLLKWEKKRRSLEGAGLIDLYGWFFDREKQARRVNRKIEKIKLV